MGGEEQPTVGGSEAPPECCTLHDPGRDLQVAGAALQSRGPGEALASVRKHSGTRGSWGMRKLNPLALGESTGSPQAVNPQQ